VSVDHSMSRYVFEVSVDRGMSRYVFDVSMDHSMSWITVYVCVVGQKVDATLLVEASNQPTNLLVTFLEYCSVVSQDIKGAMFSCVCCFHLYTSITSHPLRLNVTSGGHNLRRDRYTACVVCEV